MGIISGVAGALGSMLGGSSVSSMLGDAADGIKSAASDFTGGLKRSFSGEGASAGISSALQGSNPPPPGGGASFSESMGSMVGKAGSDILSGVASQGVSDATDHIIRRVLGDPSVAAAKSQGKSTAAYLDNAFPGVNKWDKLGAAGAGSSAVSADLGAQMQKSQFNQQTKLTKMQLDNQKEIAGINAITSRLNTKDQVYANNAQLTGMIQERQARIAKTNAEINEVVSRTDLNRQQKVNLMSSKGLIDSQTKGQLLRNDNIPLEGAVELQKGQNLRYGSGPLGPVLSGSYTTKDASTDSSLIGDYGKYLKHQSDIHRSSDGVNGAMSRK